MKLVFGRTMFAALLLIGAAQTSRAYKLGDVVAPFALKNVDGKTWSIADNRDAKGFIVVFTCNHCPFAKAYEDRIIALNATYAPKGYPVIAIQPNDATQIPDDSFDNMVKRAKEKHYAFPYLNDESETVVNAFGATNTPHVYVVQRGDKGLTVRYIGAIDNNAQDAAAATKHYVADAVNALLEGGAIAVTQTKAIGCGIRLRQ